MANEHSNPAMDSERDPNPSGPVQDPPQRVIDIFKKLGPGLIIAASIVGSGELIATTKTGADAGMSLLWLIILGCVIKVFAQVEIGRYTITSGLPTLSALNQVPGPRIPGRGNWLVWYWFLMWFMSIAQLGGIVGGVGQAMALFAPITQQGQLYNEVAEARTQLQVMSVTAKRDGFALESDPEYQRLATSADKLRQNYQEKYPSPAQTDPLKEPKLALPLDDRLWTVPWSIVTAWLLWWGRYRVIQAVSTTLVAIFTLITVGNVLSLQTKPTWAITAQQWIDGLVPHLPPGDDSWKVMGVALATLGIIGVGAAELVQYPYWLLEKGYARWTGRDDGTEAWVGRARGWMRVMRYDAWNSMIIYTLATVAFYALGAAILNRANLQPESGDLIRTLAVMYQPVFSSWAPILFLFGAFVVLYSTFYVANASHARTFADGMVVMGVLKHDPVVINRTVQYLSLLFPMLCCVIYCLMPQPVLLVLLSAVTQSIMLPMLGFAALYFRYAKCHPALRPTRLWDVLLWGSSAVLLVIGLFTLFTQGWKLLGLLG